MNFFIQDLLISYWIFAWYILYVFKITKYNPKIWIIFILFGIFIMGLILLYHKKYILFITFGIINIIVKVIPLWTLYNSPIMIVDFFAGLLLFIVYNFWLLYNNETIYTIYNKLMHSLLYDNTSIMYYLTTIIFSSIK
jgi:hypothetical protein